MSMFFVFSFFFFYFFAFVFICLTVCFSLSSLESQSSWIRRDDGKNRARDGCNESDQRHADKKLSSSLYYVHGMKMTDESMSLNMVRNVAVGERSISQTSSIVTWVC